MERNETENGTSKRNGDKRDPMCRPNKANTPERFLSVSSFQVFVLYSTKFKDIRIADTEEFNILNEKGWTKVWVIF